MQSTKTIFEKIVAGEIPSTKIYEDTHTYAFLDNSPGSIGHTLVIPKQPFKNIYEIPTDVAGPLLQTVIMVAKAMKTGLGCDGVNIVMNNDKAAGQVVFHAHIHVIPRREGDGGYSHKHLSYKEGEAEQVARSISRAIIQIQNAD